MIRILGAGKKGRDKEHYNFLFNGVHCTMNLKLNSEDLKPVITLYAESSTNETVNTAHSVSATSSKDQTSTASYADDVMFSFFANQSNASQLDNEDLEQIDANDLEEMDLKWKVAMLTMRVNRFIKKTGRKLDLNGKETVGFDRTKVECYNCHRRGHFAKECRAPRNHGNRNRDDPRSNALVDTSTTNALVVQDEIGLSSSNFEVHTWSKDCLKSYEALQKLYDQQREALNKSNLEIIGYQIGLESLEAMIVVHEKNEAVYEENIAFLKYDVQVKDISIKDLKNQLEEALKEKDDLKLKLEKFEESSKNLTKLINSQISAKDKTGLGYDSQMNESELNNIHINESEVVHSVFNSRESDVDDSPVNDRFKTGEGFHAVPPPYTGNYMPSRPDLSFAGLDDSVYKTKVSETETSISKTSKDIVEKPKTVRPSAPIIEEWDTDSANDSENTYRQVEYPRKSQSPRDNRRNWNGMMTQKLGNGFEFIKKACFVCGSFNHLIKDCDFHDNKMVEKPVLNNKGRVTGQREIRPQSSPRAATSISTARPVNIVAPKPKVNDALPITYYYFKAHSPVRRTFNQKSAAKTNNFNEKVNTARVNNVTIAGPKAVVSAAERNGENIGNPQYTLQDQGIFDSGCSRNMTRNKSFLTDYQEINGGFVAFEGSPKGGSPKGGKITRKGKIRTEKLDFEDVYFVKELKFNLFSVLQMCDKKNNVLFTETECLVLSPDFKLLDESQVLLKVPRQNNMYSFDLKNVVPSGDSLLPTTFWAEAISTACYVQNRVLVTKPHNKTPYELLHGRPPSISFMRPFGCFVTILNTLDPLGKFNEKADEGFFVGYSINSKAFRSSKDAVDDDAGKKTNEEPAHEGERNGYANSTSRDSIVSLSVSTARQNFTNADDLPTNHLIHDLEDTGILSDAYDNEDVGANADHNNLEITMNRLVDLPKGKHAIGTKWVYRNKKDKRGIVVRNKARLVAQGYTQEEGINYDEVFAPVARIEAIRLFLAYASFMGFIVYQMDVKSAFLYGTIEEEVYVCQPPGFEDPQFPDKVYKVEKALYGLHQAPRAWYETLSTYLLENGFIRGIINKTLFIKKDKGDILLVQVYVDDIIFGSTKNSLCVEFEQMMHKKFQMSSMGELTFFLGLQVMQKDDGFFISQDKYVADILKKFDFITVKIVSTPIETNKALLKDKEAEDVDVHLYRLMIGSLIYLKASRPDIMFSVYACARFQVTPKVSHLNAVKRIFRYLKGLPKLGLWYLMDSPFDLEAFSDSDYAGASLDRKSTIGGCQFLGKSCYGQVLWIQNQMRDYGFYFMNTKIYIDNESTICIVKNPVFHSKTKHIEIRHHFIRDSYEKKLIQVIKIHTDHNVADLLTKDFDVSRMEKATTNASSLEAEQDSEAQIRFEAASKHSNDLPLSRVNTLRSGEDIMKLKELMELEDDRVVRAATTASSLEAKQESGNIHKTRPTVTLNKTSPQVLGSGSGPRRQDTTLGGADAQTSGEDNMEHPVDLTDFVPLTPHDSPLLGGHTPGSDEGRPNFNELINLCTQLSNRVLVLENSKTAQDLVIQKLKRRVKRLEKALRLPSRWYLRERLDKENVSKQGRKSDKTKPMFNDSDFDVLDDAMENVKGGSTAKQITTVGDNYLILLVSNEMTTIADTLVAIRSARPRTTSVMIHNVEEEPRRATLVQSQDKGKGKMVEPEPTPKNPRKAQIQMDEEPAQRLFEEEL
ncbi:putative ribonuclease H-like domain-containing protein [Tanacetum coccineum]